MAIDLEKRWEPFIGKMEEAAARADADFVEGNMPRLEQAIRELQDKSHALAQLQYRAREVRDRATKPIMRTPQARMQNRLADPDAG